MSHRICYGHLAIRFPQDVLRAALDDWRLYQDQYVLLELGGDNNMTTISPHTRREVGSRRWSISEFGTHTDIIRKSCHLAAYCESGGMRLYGERNTTPEGYLRRTRNTLKEAVSVQDASSMGFSMSAKLSCNPNSEHGQALAQQLAMLSAHIPVTVDGDLLRWGFNPMHDMKHAALLMVSRNIDTEESWDVISADGPRFDFDKVRDRFRQMVA